MSNNKEFDIFINRVFNPDGSVTDSVKTMGLQDLSKEKQAEEIFKMCISVAQEMDKNYIYKPN